MVRRIRPAAGDWWAERPRAVLLVRAGLYLAAAAVVAALAAATAAFLGVLVAFAGVAALVNPGGLPGAVPLGGLGLALFLTLAALVAVGVRRLDARVVAAAERPDPLERLQRRYVNADIDEVEFERRLDRLLDESGAGGSGSPARPAPRESSRSSAERHPESERA